MRTLSTTSKLLAFAAAALGVVASLGLPWFAASPAAEVKQKGLTRINEPTEKFFGGVERWLTASDGVSAHERFATADIVLMALAAIAVLGAGLAVVKGGELVGRWIMQAAAVAILGLVAVKLVQIAATDDLVEARHGAVLAVGCGGVMLLTAAHVAQQKLKRKPPPTMSALHDPTLTRPGSVAPPGR